MRVTSVVTVLLGLIVCNNAESTEAETALRPAAGRQALPGRLSNGRLLRTGDSLETEDSEERAPNGWSLKNLKANLSWTKSGREAAAAKKLEEVNAARAKAYVNHSLNSRFIEWHAEDKAAVDAIAKRRDWAKSQGMLDATAENLVNQYRLWLEENAKLFGK